MNKGKRKKLLLLTALLLLIVALAALGICFFLIKTDTEDGSGRRPGGNFFGENIITASGITATGMTEEACELDFLETKLYVEESYLSMGDTVEAGAKVFKVSDESLEEAREELERTATEAELKYRQGVIDYETGRLEAERTLELSGVNKEYVQAEFDSAVSVSKEKVKDLEKQVEEAQELYDEYSAAAESNYYYTEYRVEELQNTYYDNFTFLMELYERWDIEGLNDKYPGGGSGTGSMGGMGQGAFSARAGNESSNGSVDSNGNKDSDGGSGGNGSADGSGQSNQSRNRGVSNGGSDESSKLTVYEMMEELVTANGEEYESAVENYEKDTLMAAASLDQARSNLDTLQAELEEARLQYEKQVITAEAERDTTLAESENAQSVYDTTLRKLEEEYETLKDDKEDAQENLALFEETLGDGYFYTGSAGTVVMNRVRTGQYLSGSDMLLAYSNLESVTVAASVEQADIAQITPGDSAYVAVSGYGNYKGTVLSINPVAASDSRSSITYTVNIELTGDIDTLESNLTAVVYLGLTDEQIKQMNVGVKEPDRGVEE